MNKQNRLVYMALGISAHAFSVAVLQNLSMITVTPMQQAVSETFFLIFATVIALISME